MCWYQSSGTWNYNDGISFANGINAKYPRASDLYSVISQNGWNSGNTPFQYDKWQPISDSYNDWMQLGNQGAFSQIHCINHGCPSWGTANNYGQYKQTIGYVC